MNSKLKYSLYVGILVLLGYYISQIDLGLVLSSYTKIKLNYVWIILISFVAYFSATYAWKLCLTSSKLPNWHLFKIRHIGEMLSSVNPTSVIAGDGIKYYLLKDQIDDTAQLAGSIMLSRLVLIISFLLISFSSIIGISLLKTNHFLLYFSIPAFLGLTLIVRFLYLILSSELRVANWYARLNDNRLKFLYKEKWSEKILKLNKATATFYKDHKLKFLGAVVFSIVHWLLGAGEFMIILHLLDIDISFGQAIFLECGVVMFKNLLAFIPGQLGIEELGNKVMLDLIAVPDPTIWLSLSIVKRTRQMFWILIGLIFYLFTFKFNKDENIVYHT